MKNSQKSTESLALGGADEIKVGLPPIADNNAKLLILGSLPGDESIRRQQYYAHPQNHFWRIMAALLCEELPEEYEKRREMLLRHDIALWDVLHCAERGGSSDNKIKNETPNDLRGFLREHSGIHFILINGATGAGKFFKKHFGSLGIPCAVVRSSSPTPAQSGNTLEEKTALWRKAMSEANIDLSGGARL